MRSPVFLATELEYPDDPLKPGLGTSNYNPSFEWPDARIKTDFLNGHHSTVAPGLVALLLPNLQATAQQPISDSELLAFNRFREQLHKTQVLLATLIMCARPDYSQIQFMNWYGLPMETWTRYTTRSCQRASCATYGRDPCTLLHERLSTDSARSQTMQRH